MNGNHYGVNDWTWVARHGDLNLDQLLGWFWVIPRTTRSWHGKNGPPGNPGFFISCPPVVGIRHCAFGGNTVAISRGKTPNSLIESSRLVGRRLRWGDADWQSWLQPCLCCCSPCPFSSGPPGRPPGAHWAIDLSQRTAVASVPWCSWRIFVCLFLF